MKDRKESERNQHRVENRNDGGRAIGPFKAKSDEEQHSNQGRNRHCDRLITQLGTRDLAHRIGTFDLVRGFGVILETLLRIRLRSE